MRTKLWRSVAAAALSVALVGAGTATANAASHESRSKGSTRVVVDPAVYNLIAGAGITPAAIKPAVAYTYGKTLAARFPISSINVGKLTVNHKGGIKLSAGKATISLSNFAIDLNKLRVYGSVSGTVGKVPRAYLFTIVASDKPSLGSYKLLLTKTSAGALNTTFGVDAFAQGGVFGYAKSSPRG